MLLLPAIPIVLSFLWAGLHRLDCLGLYFDETIFINAALGGADEGFIHGRVFGIPTYIMPYIGALKSWIYAPIFWLFGVDPWSVRVPGILISLATILLLTGHVRRRLGPGWGLATLLLLCTDPGLLLTSRSDYGPTVLMGLFKALALVGFFRWLEQPSSPRMLLWIAALVLGVWNKLDFLWILIAYGVAAISLHGERIRDTLRVQGRRAKIPLALLCLALLGFVLGPVRLTLSQASPSIGSSIGTWDRWVHIWHVFLQAFDGRGISEFQFPGLAHPGSEFLLLPLAGLLALPFLLHGRALSDGLHRMPLFFLLSSVLIFAQAALTPQTGGAHHLLLLWPFPQLFAISVLAGVSRNLGKAYGRLAAVASSLLLLVVVATQVRVELRYLNLLSQPELMSPKWSPKIYQLSLRLESMAVDLIVSTDWGLHSQLSSLASAENRSKYRDLWPLMKTLQANSSAANELLSLLEGNRCAFLVHAERSEEQVPTRQNTLRFLDSNFPEREILKLADDSGLPLYEIHMVDDS